MTFTVEIEQGEKEPIVILAVKRNGDPLPGKTNLKIKIRRLYDGSYFDWDDNEFKSAASVTTMLWPLIEVSALYSQGEYHLNKADHVNGFDTASIINPETVDNYFITAIQDGGTDAANIPMIGEIKVVELANIIEDHYPVIF